MSQPETLTITEYDYKNATEFLDQTIETKGPETPDEAITHAMDNFASPDAMFSISHRLIPIKAFFEVWEPRLLSFVGIPQGMNRPLLPANYFTFWRTFFTKNVQLSASRKGIGRQQTMNVLMAYFTGVAMANGLTPQPTEEKKEHFHAIRNQFRKARGEEPK